MSRLSASVTSRSSGVAAVIGLGAGLLGAVAIYLASADLGLGMSNDGVLYASAARHLVRGLGVTDFRGDPLVIFPPLLPTTLAWMTTILPTIESAERALQMSLYVGNLVLSAVLFARIVPSRTALFLFVVAVLASRTFLLYHLFLLSEPLFVLLSLGMLLVLLSWAQRPRSWLLLGAGVLCALSCLTRYTGAANVVAGLAAVAWFAPDWRHRARSAVLFATTSVVPITIWLIRNSQVSGSLTGSRLPSPYPFLLNLQLLVDSLSKWLLPDEIAEWLRLLAVLIGLGLLVVVLVQMQKANDARNTERVVLLQFTSVHVLFLVVATTVFASDYITTRFVMPMYVPLLVLAACAATWLVTHGSGVRTTVLSIIIVWMAFQLFTSVRLVSDRIENGIGGYATVDWKDSDTMAFIAENGDDVGSDVYSNAPLGIYHWSWQVVNFFPDRLNERWQDYSSKNLFDRPTIEDFAEVVSEPRRRVVLVWFDAAQPDARYESLYLFNQYTLEEIKKRFRLETIYAGSDGGVYRVLPI